MSEDDLESLRETAFWLSQPGIRDDIAEARSALARGEALPADDLRARLGRSSS